MGHLYLIRNTLNGKGYIGKTEQTIAQRFSHHVHCAKKGSSFPLHRAMRKYGVENFEVTEILSFGNEYLYDLEKSFIAIEGTYGNQGYNATKGGEGSSCPRSSEAIRKHAEALRGRPQSEEQIRKRVAARKFSQAVKLAEALNLGETTLKRKPHSEEAKHKIRESNKALFISGKRKPTLHWRGRKHSEASKLKMSQARKGKTGRTLSEATRLKISEAKKANWALRKAL